MQENKSSSIDYFLFSVAKLPMFEVVYDKKWLLVRGGSKWTTDQKENVRFMLPEALFFAKTVLSDTNGRACVEVRPQQTAVNNTNINHHGNRLHRGSLG